MHGDHHESARVPLVGRLEALAVVAVIGLLALALGVTALAMPTAKSEKAKVGYTQHGTFAYTGTAPVSSPYGRDGVKSGEPILTDVVKDANVRFTYRFTSSAPSTVHGMQSLAATVTLDQGLTRQFPIAAEQRFTGPTVTTSGSLPLADILRYINSASAALGSTTGSGATVTIAPQVEVSGRVGGQELQAEYAPALKFTYDGRTLSVVQDPSNALLDDKPKDPLTPSEEGTVQYDKTVANAVPLLVVHPSVTVARIAGLTVAALCLALGLYLARPLMRDSDEAAPDRIRTLYGSLLVPVSSLEVPSAAVAEVASIGALVELAKRYESMIMHRHREDGDEYMVWDDGMLYRFAPQRADDASRPDEAEPGAEQIDEAISDLLRA